MTPEQALVALQEIAQEGRAAEMAAYHKVDRVYLGVSNPDIDVLTKAWRAEVTLEERLF